MKLGTLSLTIAITVLAAAGSAVAFQKQNSSNLGAPIYAGSNTIVVQNGRGDWSYGSSSSVTVSGTIYGRQPRGYGRGGRGYDRRGPGYRPYYGGRYGYQPYYKQPRRGYGRGYYRPYDPYYRGNGRGYGRGYGRERYPNPNVFPFGGFGGNRYGNDRGRDRGPRLTILGATYRSVDGRACDAYSYAHRKCDGNQSCTVKASNNICGDPDRGRLKILEVTYACGNQQYTANTPEKSRSKLRCR
ncbi:MAG: hypothetical protein GKS03_12140 [Alphaproteobacteria bacterium]|nr:hypothetical protein [Alphaproteobacteria bacterium]